MSALLLEQGGYLLQENGGKVLLTLSAYQLPGLTVYVAPPRHGIITERSNHEAGISTHRHDVTPIR